MKRAITLILCFLMVFCLFAACGQTEEESVGMPANTFCVGYGQADISPLYSVYLRGYGDPQNERMMTEVLEPLYVSTVAITDEKNTTAIIITTDLLMSDKAIIDPLRKQISEEYNIPGDYIMFGASHNHSGPESTDTVYRVRLNEQILASVKTAMEDRKPATMEKTFTRPKGFNSVRHYLMIDGTFVGEGVGTYPKDQVYGHFKEPDNLLQLLRFKREGGIDIIMINWQGHPRGTDPFAYTAATSNYPGIMRTNMEEALNCKSLFFLGGSGDMNNNTQIPHEKIHADYIELGEALAEEAVKAAENFKPINTGDIQISKSFLDYSGKEADAGAPLYAMSFGDFAIAFAPFEIFHMSAVGVKESSDFKMTFYSSCSNGSYGYLPTPPSFDWVHHYEVRITKYPKGTAELVESILTRLVADCFAASGNEVSEKEEGYISGPFEPYTDGKEYVNPAMGSDNAYKVVENGYCQVTLLVDGKPRMFLAANEDVAKEVVALPTMKLLFDEQNCIAGIAN